MHINLIPACEYGTSYGGDLLREALARFRKQLLAVIIVCHEEQLKHTGPFPLADNITSAWIDAAIVLFREPGSIGQVTGFILEEGLNINWSGTGGRYGQAFLRCLVDHNVRPWFYPMNTVLELMAQWSGQGETFDLEGLPNYQRLEYWERFLIDKISPLLYSETWGIAGDRTGSFPKSWQAGDISRFR